MISGVMTSPGARMGMKVSDAYSYEVEIRSITKTQDDGSAPVL